MTSSQSGLCLIPLMLGTVVGATTSGNVMARFRHYKRLPTAGLVAAMAGTASSRPSRRSCPCCGSR
jgi:hypothetical protein